MQAVMMVVYGSKTDWDGSFKKKMFSHGISSFSFNDRNSETAYVFFGDENFALIRLLVQPNSQRD